MTESRIRARIPSRLLPRCWCCWSLASAAATGGDSATRALTQRCSNRASQHARAPGAVLVRPDGAGPALRETWQVAVHGHAAGAEVCRSGHDRRRAHRSAHAAERRHTHRRGRGGSPGGTTSRAGHADLGPAPGGAGQRPCRCGRHPGARQGALRSGASRPGAGNRVVTRMGQRDRRGACPGVRKLGNSATPARRSQPAASIAGAVGRPRERRRNRRAAGAARWRRHRGAGTRRPGCRGRTPAVSCERYRHAYGWKRRSRRPVSAASVRAPRWRSLSAPCREASFRGTVEALLPRIDPASRTQWARIVLANPEGGWRRACSPK